MLILEIKKYILELNFKILSASYEIIYATLIIESGRMGNFSKDVKHLLANYRYFLITLGFESNYTISLFLVVLLFNILNSVYILGVCLILDLN